MSRPPPKPIASRPLGKAADAADGRSAAGRKLAQDLSKARESAENRLSESGLYFVNTTHFLRVDLSAIFIISSHAGWLRSTICRTLGLGNS